MEAIKEIAAVAGAVIGVLTALVTLGAKLLDLKQKADKMRQEDAALVVGPAVSVSHAPTPVIDPAKIERAQKRVKGPAIALLLVGCFGLLSNGLNTGLMLMTYVANERGGYYDQPNDPPDNGRATGQSQRHSRGTMMTLIVMSASFSVAAGMAIWAAANMIRLRSYWLSVAGSLAIMPGACLCFIAAVPLGIWSLIVLFDPEVSESFR